MFSGFFLGGGGGGGGEDPFIFLDFFFFLVDVLMYFGRKIINDHLYSTSYQLFF